MKRFYLVRHGESEANVAKVHGGPHHPLSERGRKQAEFIAERCAKLPLQAVYASTMVRAHQTGEAIAQRAGLALRVADGLHEVAPPSHLRDRPFTEKEFLESLEHLVDNLAPGRRYADEENFDDIVARATQALQWLAGLPEEHVAVVSHGLFLRCLMACAIFGSEITPRELLAIWRGFRSENTGLTILEYRPDMLKAQWRVFVWNDHAHLG
jgi:broad specificity phosphatase PhoE